jgi:hypothetical protein
VCAVDQDPQQDEVLHRIIMIKQTHGVSPGLEALIAHGQLSQRAVDWVH